MVTREVNIDINEPQTSACWTVQQNEYNSRQLKFNLTKDRMAYAVPSQSIVVLKFVKPDNTYIIKRCGYTGSTIVVDLDRQMVAVDGTAIGKLSIIYAPDPTIDPYHLLNTATYILDTVAFKVKIDKDILDEAQIISSNEYTFFQEIIDKVVGWTAPYIDTDTNEWIVDGEHTGIIASGGGGGNGGGITINSKMYSLKMSSSNGNIFRNKNINTTLTCTVWSWDEDITDLVTSDSFVWSRSTDDKESDELWNFEHANMSNIISVTDNDCSDTKTIFKCEVSMTNGVNLNITLEIQNINDSISIKSIVCQYGVSDSINTLPTEWGFSIPSYTDEYLWVRDYITYSNDTVSTTGERINNIGSSGEQGVGIENVELEFYLSTSKAGQINGEWSIVQPAWESGKYLWNRTKITYTNNKVSYTTPICDLTWESLGDLQTEINNQITSIVETQKGTTTTLNELNQKIVNKIWSTDITTSLNEYDLSTVKVIKDNVNQISSDLNGVEEEIKSLNETVATKVDGSSITEINEKVNNVINTVDGMSQTISNLEGTIETKADGMTVSNLSEKISAIEQDATGFKQTVSDTYATKESVTNLENELSENYSTTVEMSSAIEQSATQIKTTVSAYVDGEIDDINIGGRNLIQNSETLDFLDYYFEEHYAINITNTDGDILTYLNGDYITF